VTNKEVNGMANQEHLDVLRQSVKAWNLWMENNREGVQPDLRDADLSGTVLARANFWLADLRGANLSGANLGAADFHDAWLEGADLSKAFLALSNMQATDLSGANLSGAKLTDAILLSAYLGKADLTGARLERADLRYADLSGANLSSAYLGEANLRRANLSGANLSGANLNGAYLSQANLSQANLSNTDLSRTILVETNLTDANLSNCLIYGISVWDVQLEETSQEDLVITPYNEPIITVDNLKVAQFIYLLLNNKDIREVIDTITSKVVLILGRFIPERKTVLDALRNELRQHNYSPILFDFEKPASRDLTETVSTLAHLARFIIVDLTDPSSAPHEVATVIPHTVVPVQPLLSREPLIVDGKVRERREYAMFEDLRRRYHWVLPTFRYQDTAELLASLHAHIIAPAEQKARELTQPK
jgi:uncharacterized protein YjbI with pentapeptide repeats